MDAFDTYSQAQRSIRASVDRFLPRAIDYGSQQKWYQQPVIGTRRPATASQGFSGTGYIPKALQGFLAENSYDNLMYKKQAAAMAAALQDPGTGQGPSTGMGDPSGGDWANVNKWNSQINTAINRVASEFGVNVPGNVVKAVMKLESGGVNVGCNFAGYCGLMQTGPGSNVRNFDANYNSTPEGNLYYGVQELANWYKAVGTGNWIDAAAAYFSGYNYNNPNVSDGYGTTVGQYRQIIQQNLNALNSATQTGGVAGQPWSGGGNAMNVMFGGRAQTPSWGAFGASSSNGLYGYGTEYGLNGSQHTGWDIPLPVGSPLYAPGPGRVICGATNDGNACCCFNDYYGNGAGRIEIELANGVRVIFGHSSTTNVRAGQMVQAGQMIGTSGGMNSPHTHLEVRVPDSRYPSGYRLVDAVQYFGGYVGGPVTGGTGGTGAAAAPVRQQGWDALRQILGQR